MSIFDELPHITSRIEAFTASGRRSQGTGFFFSFEDTTRRMPALVTNKHVLKDAIRLKIYISRENGGRPDFGSFNSWELLNFSNIIVEHPDPTVDLVALPIGAVLAEMTKAGTPPYYRALTAKDIPSPEEVEQLTAIEDVFMIGYPTGIWDQKNNLPIVRRGITATPYGIDHDGKPEFMIDCACFPGSSGSPVVIANHGSYSTKNGDLNIGSRFYFLGLLWGGPQYTTQGDIVAMPVPTSLVPKALSQIPTNLGYCVKSRMVLDLAPLLWAKCS